jgi:hypothetical protein
VGDPRPDGVLLSRLEDVPSERILDLLGVQYVLASWDTAGRLDLETYDLGDLRMFARRGGLPLSRLVFNASAPVDDDEALTRLSVPQLDPGQQVLLSSSNDVVGGPLSSTRGAMDVQPDLVEPGRWRARVSVPEPAYLVQREAWYPGWRARVDGTEVPVLRADVLYRAVALPPGEHTVELWFEPASFQRGMLLSVLGLAGCLILTSWSVVRTRVRIIGQRGRRSLSNRTPD